MYSLSISDNMVLIYKILTAPLDETCIIICSNLLSGKIGFNFSYNILEIILPSTKCTSLQIHGLYLMDHWNNEMSPKAFPFLLCTSLIYRLLNVSWFDPLKAFNCCEKYIFPQDGMSIIILLSQSCECAKKFCNGNGIDKGERVFMLNHQGCAKSQTQVKVVCVFVGFIKELQPSCSRAGYPVWPLASPN